MLSLAAGYPPTAQWLMPRNVLNTATKQMESVGQVSADADTAAHFAWVASHDLEGLPTLFLGNPTHSVFSYEMDYQQICHHHHKIIRSNVGLLLVLISQH